MKFNMEKKDIFLTKQDSIIISKEMFENIKELFPICRSITGNGVRKSLEIIKKKIPLQIHEVSSGTKVFDWTIPKEWNIEDAYIIDPNGKKIIDFKNSNLHVVNYSIPVNKTINLSELKGHIYTIPEKPDLIPYVTSYYDENWGFCMTYNQFSTLKEGQYKVVIDSSLTDGSLTYGEFLIQGKYDKEILLSCYVCHPSMCNDNLSGVVIISKLAEFLQKLKTNYSIRFLFIPETIGAITWLYLNESKISKIKHGLVATCLGDSGLLTYKKTRKNFQEIDITVEKVLKNLGINYRVLEFFPWGSDERQFCSPGFDLPIGSLIRSMYGKDGFPEYHTSGDNLNLMNLKSLEESFIVYLSVIMELDKNFEKFKPKKESKIKDIQFHNESKSRKYLNLLPKGEPQLGKRGIYHKIGGQERLMNQRNIELGILWILNLSDGINSIEEISRRSGIHIDELDIAIKILINSDILKEIE